MAVVAKTENSIKKEIKKVKRKIEMKSPIENGVKREKAEVSFKFDRSDVHGKNRKHPGA